MVQTLKMVCSGFRIGTQFRQGRRTLGMTGFFKGTPGGAILPPMGGGGGTGGAPKFNDHFYSIMIEVECIDWYS